MTTLAQAARRLADQRPGHRVVSLYLDLDPERFATPPARTSQVQSLIDEAAKDIDDTELAHEDKVALRDDLQRLREYLLSGDPPFRGARALAVFRSGPADLFEVVQLPRSVPGRVVIDTRPYVEPLLAAAAQREWCVVLVNRRVARLFAGPVDTLSECTEVHDDVHGQHDQGGWSQPRYERSIEKEVDDHLRGVAELIERRCRAGGFDRLALGGPTEVVPRLEALLSEEVSARRVAGRVDADVSTASEGEVRTSLLRLADEDDRRIEREALDRMAAGVGSGGRGAGGPQDTVAALNERRVATLLLEDGFDATAQRCPTCGMLVIDGDGDGDGEGGCPADGSQLEDVAHLREAVTEAALAQDAEVVFVRHHPDLGPFEGIGAVLRF